MKEIGTLQHLIHLDLSRNRLNSLPKEIGNLKLLKRLSISDNCISYIPTELFQFLTSLVELYATNNQIESLPPEIQYLCILEELQLGNNRLTSLPVEITKLPRLSILNLSSNLLTRIPIQISRLRKSLSYLDIGKNEIVFLPASLGEFRQQIPKEFRQQIPKEFHLSASGNPTIVPPSIYLDNVHQLLKYLSEYSGCQVEVLPSSFSKDFVPFCLSEDFADVTFSVSGRKAPGHRVLLSIQSPYLKSLFHEGSIIEVDYPYEVFKQVKDEVTQRR